MLPLRKSRQSCSAAWATEALPDRRTAAPSPQRAHAKDLAVAEIVFPDLHFFPGETAGTVEWYRFCVRRHARSPCGR